MRFEEFVALIASYLPATPANLAKLTPPIPAGFKRVTPTPAVAPKGVTPTLVQIAPKVTASRTASPAAGPSSR
jgi:hypothetical protein